MKKPMIKALACSLAFTLALSTPVAVSAEGISSVYSVSEESDNKTKTNTNTNTNTDTNSNAEIIDEADYSKVIGLVVNPEQASVEVGKEITLEASILVGCEAEAGTDSFRSMSLNDLAAEEDMVVVFEGEEILAAKLAEKLTWYEESEEDYVAVTNNNDGTATVAGTNKGATTVSVKLGDVYKASATVNVKKYAEKLEFKADAPKVGYLKHNCMNLYDFVDMGDANDDITWNIYQRDNKGKLKVSKAATVAANGQITFKKLTNGKNIIIKAVSERGLWATHEMSIEKGTPATKVTAGTKSYSLEIKEENLNPEQEVSVALTPVDTTDCVTWTSNKSNIATVVVDANDKTKATIIAQNPGTAKITAKATSGKKVVFTVKVTAPLQRIETIVSVKENIYQGQSVQLEAVKVPHNATDKIKFKLSDNKSMKKYATVNAKGVLKANKKNTGKVSVIAYTTGKNAKSSTPVEFEIKPSTLTKITITNAKKNGTKNVMTLYKNKSFDFNAVFENGTEEMATWSSNKAKVSTVDDAGVAKALAAGKAKITVSGVKADGKTVKDTVTVTVLQPVTKIQLNKTDVTVNPKTNKAQNVSLKVSKQLPKGAKEDITWTIEETNSTATFGFKSGKASVASITANSVKVVVPTDAKLGDYVVVKATAASGATEYATITVCNKTSKVQFTDTKNVMKNATVAVGDKLVNGTNFAIEVLSAATDANYNEDIVSFTANNSNVRIEGDVIYVLKSGKTTITAKTASGKKATLKLTINAE